MTMSRSRAAHRGACPRPPAHTPPARVISRSAVALATSPARRPAGSRSAARSGPASSSRRATTRTSGARHSAAWRGAAPPTTPAPPSPTTRSSTSDTSGCRHARGYALAADHSDSLRSPLAPNTQIMKSSAMLRHRAIGSAPPASHSRPSRVIARDLGRRAVDERQHRARPRLLAVAPPRDRVVVQHARAVRGRPQSPGALARRVARARARRRGRARARARADRPHRLEAPQAPAPRRAAPVAVPVVATGGGWRRRAHASAAPATPRTARRGRGPRCDAYAPLSLSRGGRASHTLRSCMMDRASLCASHAARARGVTLHSVSSSPTSPQHTAWRAERRALLRALRRA